MREYEMMVVYDLAVAEAGGGDAASQHLTQLLESRGGKVLKVDHWGRRRMAYPINRALDGDYVLTRVELEPAAVREVEGALKINERVYRHLVVRADELPIPPPPREPRAPRAEEAAAVPAEAAAELEAAAEAADVPAAAEPVAEPEAAAEAADAPAAAEADVEPEAAVAVADAPAAGEADVELEAATAEAEAPAAAEEAPNAAPAGKALPEEAEAEAIAENQPGEATQTPTASLPTGSPAGEDPGDQGPHVPFEDEETSA